ncbi:hypothetical protein [Paenibacillus antibioticophila]|uniref:hypothetical protein n=1 Tax=Paenibacillus antibioticophila TaxID=1274374 RepID=UPI001BB3EB16|nr:hypothetical protein [Paenibacillus antibioticophila]
MIGKSNDVSKRQEQRAGGSGSPVGGTHEAAAREDGNVREKRICSCAACKSAVRQIK